MIKLSDGLLAPPSMKIPVLIEQPALVIEAVGDLVADHHAYAPVIQAAREVSVIKRRL